MDVITFLKIGKSLVVYRFYCMVLFQTQMRPHMINKGSNTGLIKTHFLSVKLLIFPYPSVLTYVLGAQKNRLIETVLWSTHNICFGWEIRKSIFWYALLIKGLTKPIIYSSINSSGMSFAAFSKKSFQEYHLSVKQTGSRSGPTTCRPDHGPLFVCFVALRPKSTAMVIAGRSVHLTTLLPGQAWTSG